MIYNVLIYDEIPIVSIGLGKVIKTKFPLCDIYIANNTDDLLKFMAILNFDLIFLDIAKNGFNEFSLLVKIKKKQPGIKLVLFSISENVEFKKRSFKYGVNAILKKSCPELSIHQIIDIFLFGESISRRLTENFIELKSRYRKSKNKTNSIDSLSLREYELALLIISGEKVIDIANSLDIATSTVCTYKKRIFNKTNTNSALQLAELFRKKDINY